MYRLIELLLAAVLLIPFYALLYNRVWKTPTAALLSYLFAFYLCALYSFTGLPTVQFIRFEVHINWIPGVFRDLRNSALNTMLFVPLGFLLPVLWKKYRSFVRTVTFGFGLSLSIELLQILTFRATDVDDLITNTLGAAIGYAAFRIAKKLCPAISREDRNGGTILVPILVTVFVMFFLQPPLATLVYRIL